jgi:uncharacterized protein (DUF305 family)
VTHSKNSAATRRFVHPACGATLAAALATAALAQAPIVNPGAPGGEPRPLRAEEAIALARTAYTSADVQFLRGMIPHHQQALAMAALAKDRTNRKELLDAAGRIEASQEDEIEFMQGWLEERNELGVDGPATAAAAAEHTAHTTAGAPAADHANHANPAAHSGLGMKGMATPEQLAALAAASGTDFDRLFLTLMIKHHEGAVQMVEALTEQPGSAYEPALFEFTRDVTNDQNAEIERMNVLLVGLSADARAALKPGFDDAGEAILNLTKVFSLPKPPGFFDPANPANLPPKRLAALAAGADDEGRRRRRREDDAPASGNSNARSPLLSFANTDLAFRDDVMVVGSYHGFNVYRLARAAAPELLSSVVCPGGQGDVSIVGDLLIMSVEQMRGRVDCGLEGVAAVDASPERFRGLRIFDIADPARPKQVGQVQTCRGSHTHSVVASDANRIVVYNSGTAGVREEEELAGCIGAVAGDTRTALFRVDIIEIPVSDPSRARIVDSPTVFADLATGVIAGLWRGGDHGDDTQETNETNHCHDITVFPALAIAAGACSGNGIVFDIADPLKPRRIDSVVDKGFAYWHSATFNNDATKVIFTDEWGGGSRPRCRAHDPLDWGADAIYDLVDGKLVYRSHFKIPAPQVDEENCVAHNGSIIPVPGRDLMVQSWYQGGLSVWDFTDSASPVEIAYFDRGPIDEKELVLAGYWSSYWYAGRIYATEIVRGLDVFALQPSAFLSQNEIDAAVLADQGRLFNPQQQFPVAWPAEPVVARAYVDQLRRGPSGEAAATLAQLDDALELAAQRLAANANDAALAARLESLARGLSSSGGDDAVTRKRKSGLATTLSGLAARLQ